MGALFMSDSSIWGCRWGRLKRQCEFKPLKGAFKLLKCKARIKQTALKTAGMRLLGPYNDILG